MQAVHAHLDHAGPQQCLVQPEAAAELLQHGAIRIVAAGLSHDGLVELWVKGLPHPRHSLHTQRLKRLHQLLV